MLGEGQEGDRLKQNEREGEKGPGDEFRQYKGVRSVRAP